MAKKQFIRHLEFYGFPDQNEYASGFGDIDLSDIREKNKEQDEEIGDLENEKADKSDLVSLSGAVESMITQQSIVNQEFADAISGNTERINLITDKINEIGDTVNDVIDNVQELDEKVSGITDDLAELSGKVETFSSETKTALDDIENSLDGKLDKTEAEETYLKKGEAYSKEETDAKIAEELEPYATKEWVSESGFMTQEEADERYAKKEDVDALSNKVDEVESNLKNDISSISGDVATINTKMGTLETNFATLSSEVDRKINEISGTVDTFSDRISANEEAIEDLEDELARKANKADLDNLESTVSVLSDKVDSKVSKTEFETYKSSVTNQFNNMDDKKADKTAMTQVAQSVEEVDDKLDQEITNRISGDTYILNVISGINETIVEIKEDGTNYNERITNLEDGLAEEIQNRIQGDLDLIGSETDDKDDDTIWGAKKYAKNQKSQAVLDAKAYTDQEISNLRNDVATQFNDVEQEMSGKASKAYVDASKAEVKAEVLADLNDAITEERERAEGEEHNILVRVMNNTSAIAENDRAVDHLADRVNAITSWEGTNPEEYVNTGNGVLDVLHREFHEFEKTYGSIKSIEVVDGNLIITYYTAEGEQQTTIPVSSLIDLEDYYTKEEVDAKIEEAIEGIDLEDYYTKEEVDAQIEQKADASALTEAIDGVIGDASEDYNTLGKIEDKVEEKSTTLDNLIEKLGYDENDTLVTTNSHEVAFGEYNVSNTGENDADKTIFSIGNGTSDENRSNAIEIRKDGTVLMWVEGDFMPINDLLAMLAHETY